MIRAAFFDIDGTLLLNPEGTVPPRTLEALHRLQAAGVEVVLATGRALHELDDLPIRDFPFDGYVMLNGQLCLDADRSPIYERPVEGAALQELTALFEARDVPVFLVDKNGHFLNYVDDRVRRTLEEIALVTPTVKGYEGQPLYMGGAYVTREEEPALRARIPHLDLARWHDNGVDLVVAGVGKEAGVEAFLKARGYRREESAAFGDGDNDRGMVAYAGWGVAMGNATDAVKAAADHVTNDIRADGLAQAVDKILAGEV